MLEKIKNLKEVQLIKKNDQKKIVAGDAPGGGPWGDCPNGYRQCEPWGACLRNSIPCD